MNRQSRIVIEGSATPIRSLGRRILRFSVTNKPDEVDERCGAASFHLFGDGK
jgi:hypothetical protein